MGNISRKNNEISLQITSLKVDEAKNFATEHAGSEDSLDSYKNLLLIALKEEGTSSEDPETEDDAEWEVKRIKEEGYYGSRGFFRPLLSLNL